MAEHDDSNDDTTDIWGSMSCANHDGDVFTWFPGSHLASHRQIANASGEIDQMTATLMSALDMYARFVKFSLCELCGCNDPDSETVPATDRLILAVDVYGGAITWNPSAHIRWHMQTLIQQAKFGYTDASLPVAFGEYARSIERKLCLIHDEEMDEASSDLDREIEELFKDVDRHNLPSDEHPAP